MKVLFSIIPLIIGFLAYSQQGTEITDKKINPWVYLNDQQLGARYPNDNDSIYLEDIKNNGLKIQVRDTISGFIYDTYKIVVIFYDYTNNKTVRESIQNPSQEKIDLIVDQFINSKSKYFNIILITIKHPTTGKSIPLYQGNIKVVYE